MLSLEEALRGLDPAACRQALSGAVDGFRLEWSRSSEPMIAALQNMPPMEVQVALLCLWLGWPISEAVRVLPVDVFSCRAYLNHAIKVLSDSLEQDQLERGHRLEF